MQLWLVLLGSALALAWILLLSRIWVEFELRAQGEPSGAWAAAFAVSAGPVILSGIVASKVHAKWELRVFGMSWKLPRSRKGKPSSETKPVRKRRKDPATSSVGATVDRWLPLIQRLERRVGLGGITIDVTYGFRDVALTGRIAGAMAVLSAVLPRSVKMTQQPIWAGEERWQASAGGRVGLYLGLVLSDLVWYMILRQFRHRQLSWAKPTSPRS